MFTPPTGDDRNTHTHKTFECDKNHCRSFSKQIPESICLLFNIVAFSLLLASLMCHACRKRGLNAGVYDEPREEMCLKWNSSSLWVSWYRLSWCCSACVCYCVRQMDACGIIRSQKEKQTSRWQMEKMSHTVPPGPPSLEYPTLFFLRFLQKLQPPNTHTHWE